MAIDLKLRIATITALYSYITALALVLQSDQQTVPKTELVLVYIMQP